MPGKFQKLRCLLMGDMVKSLLWLLDFALTFVVSALKLGGVLAIDSCKSFLLHVISLPLLGGGPHIAFHLPHEDPRMSQVEETTLI